MAPLFRASGKIGVAPTRVMMIIVIVIVIVILSTLDLSSRLLEMASGAGVCVTRQGMSPTDPSASTPSGPH